ncbi:carbamoyl-phosphate synthase large subunit [Acrasis kona]|uniref:Carbamoyl phosphate synthase arginine-specific large chain n=1 Tax=Acrasis kona TaxID=1008807 RepID=A0AAW2Z9T5_9EUKA
MYTLNTTIESRRKSESRGCAEGKIGHLLLDDGKRYSGVSFGAEGTISGEVVFTTAMVGYPESLTDPSYQGQILVLTYPLVGNYGVPSSEEVDTFGLPLHMESNKVHIAGLIVQDYSHNCSHWQAAQALGSWLKEHNVPALYNIDTRALTKHLRHGSRLGRIAFEKSQELLPFHDPNVTNIVETVSTKTVKEFGNPQNPKIIAVDCGIKYNIIRCLLKRDLFVKLVPFDYNYTNEHYDGLFFSNGPGDARRCVDTIKHLKHAFTRNTPIFGICLGSQLMGAASGAEVYKMPFGNRGHNQPCIDQITQKCYITSQNHGFAIRSETLPSEWRPLFVNANDGSNEGIYHVSKPFFSAQFHPEACGGPLDTMYLFDQFERYIRLNMSGSSISIPQPVPFVNKRLDVRKVIILGSGGLTIGQAGEFDYSGSQCIKALKEEGIETILINPNIATVQTSKDLADKVYFLPVTPEQVEKVIIKEKPDSILLSFGGQTGLNCGVKLYEAGILERHNVRVLGTPVSAIVDTEDRDRFNLRMREIDEKIATSQACNTLQEAVAAANRIGYPIIARAAFALGGLGSGFANNDEELKQIAKIAFASSPQLLIERSVKGWKEVEYEVVRDCHDNCIVVCNMENFDPVGVHTGESIVVCPSQTLSNTEYHMLRATAIKVIRHLGIVGECNIQYALNPESLEYVIIEVNARLSRSSALASKATGYPLAFVAAKLALGIDLPSVRNAVTRVTTACFEPSIDYCVVKMPRWDLSKFKQVSREIGSAMKSVGEVMAIGRNFQETIQKAIRMVNTSYTGFDAPQSLTTGQSPYYKNLDRELSHPTDKRIFAIADAMQNHSYTVDHIHELTKIDKWFLYKLQNISDVKHDMMNTAGDMSRELLLQAKMVGFSDAQIASYTHSDESNIRQLRYAMNVMPCVKQIDTMAAEYPAQTNYLYTTYCADLDHSHDVTFDDNGIMVLGSGVYRIGSSVEFDYCAVMCIRTLREMGYKTIMVNYNPETVSTDYDESDKLYFEELSLERVMDIYRLESSRGVIVCMGGQQPNNIALSLQSNGVNILGTNPIDIDKAENRHLFSTLLDGMNVAQPKWDSLQSISQAQDFCKTVDYPVLVRPSYVLSGAAMNVAHSQKELVDYLKKATSVSPDHPVVVTQFITGAREIEMDGVCLNGNVLVHAVSEHLEDAGVHSGDAHMVLPPHTLSQIIVDNVISHGSNICKALNITGPFNMQFLCKDGVVKVIECNVRASRSFPFVSKTLNTSFVRIATKAIVAKAFWKDASESDVMTFDENVMHQNQLKHVAVKVPMFSFKRLDKSDPSVGVEMASTGEVACFGRNHMEAFLKAKISSNFFKSGKSKLQNLLIATAPANHKSSEFVNFSRSVVDMLEMEFNIYTSHSIGERLRRYARVNIEKLQFLDLDSKSDLVLDKIHNNEIDLVVDVPQKNEEEHAHYLIRRSAVNHEVPLFNNYQIFDTYVKSVHSEVVLETEHYGEYIHE